MLKVFPSQKLGYQNDLLVSQLYLRFDVIHVQLPSGKVDDCDCHVNAALIFYNCTALRTINSPVLIGSHFHGSSYTTVRMENMIEA